MTPAARLSLPWQFRIARAAVGYAALVSACLALGLPWRISANRGEYATALLLRTFVVVGVVIAVMLTWRRRAGWAATVGLGLLATHVTGLRSIQVLSETLRPSVNCAEVISCLLGSSVLIALVTAMRCSWAVRDNLGSGRARARTGTI